MQLIGDRLVLSPTDVTKHLECPHLTTLDLLAARGSGGRPAPADDEALHLVFRLGLAHEHAYLARLRTEGRTVTEITTAHDDAGRRAAEQATLEAMRSGVDVVYQGTFYDGMWGGQADFLLRVETPSDLGAWSYEVADTKLARRMKVPALLQMALYAERLEQLQGVAPSSLYVVTGDGEQRPWRLVDVAAYARRVRARLRAFVDAPADTEAVPVGHCAQCRWRAQCEQQWVDDDDLSLVAGMRHDHREALREHGISTLEALAGCSPDDLPRGIGVSSRQRLVEQAAAQLEERRTGTPLYRLLEPRRLMGLLRLPPPDEGDLYLDFEGDPYADDGSGREYLAGLGDRSGAFTALWAHDREAERELTAALVNRLLEQWHRHPGMHVYHYAAYEITALKRLTSQHGVAEGELDRLLRGERFVDLYAVVRQGMRISKPSYSIKKLEAFYWSEERGGAGDEVTGALDSVVAYERWLVDRDDETLRQIEAYNADDVRSTRDLHEWLECRRAELETDYGVQPRPDEVEAEPEKPPSDAELAELDLVRRLHEAGHQLMADLVQWHRREDRPAWWDVYRLDKLDDDQLLDDATALGPLSHPVDVGKDKRSRLWRYTFAPQDTKLSVGIAPLDVDDHEAAGTIVDLDPVAGHVVVKRQKEPKHSRGFGPPGPLGNQVLREAVAEAGEDHLAGRPTLAQALLGRTVPADLRAREGETAGDVVVRVGRSMASHSAQPGEDRTQQGEPGGQSAARLGGSGGAVLAVQGPPGSGKTTVGGRLIRALLEDGRTVGVTATSHAVIGNLLEAAVAGTSYAALHKCTPEQHGGHDQVRQTADNLVVGAALSDRSARLVGGTSWLWARPELREAVDVLVVDEAGQYSLANALAVSRAARSMVLLGDPQQLAQPSQATHPGDAGRSALEHLLDGHDTIPADRGVFLDTSWRMHPDLTAYVSELAYDSLLGAGPGQEQQRVMPGGLVGGSGLVVVFADHAGCAAKSAVEARQVQEIWQSLQGVGCVDRRGVQRPIGVNDVLVVAPYNQQVAEIRQLLPDGARVGTVDKFQGQQAPVVVYSMTSSSAADAPRGVGFLYDLHRLNVAVSRAQALAVVVMNPALLDAPVHTPEQLRRVNAHCRLLDPPPRTPAAAPGPGR